MIIYRLGSLGDTVVALPALRLIAQAFPHEKRIMLTEFNVNSKAAPMAAILQHTQLVDEYVQYPLNLRSFKEILALRNRLKALRETVMVYLAPPRGRMAALRDALFFRACGIKKIIGLPSTPDQQALRPMGGGRFEYEGARLLRCLKPLGEPPLVPSSFDMALTAAEREEARQKLAPLQEAPLLAICIGTKADVNDWGQENWRALVAALSERLTGWGLVLIGAPVETARCADLAALWAGPVINLCGAIPVRVSAAVLERCKIYAGHDSGPMHLAAAVGTTCVAVFSSRNLPGKWFPPGPAHQVFYRDIECAGCMLLVCEERKKACIMSIRVEDVRDAVVEKARLAAA